MDIIASVAAAAKPMPCSPRHSTPPPASATGSGATSSSSSSSAAAAGASTHTGGSISPKKRLCPFSEPAAPTTTLMGPPPQPSAATAFADHYSSICNVFLATHNLSNLQELGDAAPAQTENVKDILSYAVWAADVIAREPPAKAARPAHKESVAFVNAKMAAYNYEIARYNNVQAGRRGTKEMRARTHLAFDFAKMHATRLREKRES